MGRTSVDNAAMRTRLLAFCLVFVLPVATAAQPVQQAVIDTSAGTIVWDLLSDKAPNHVALFIKTAQDGGFDGTSFHRMVRYGVVQGGDPVTKDPAARDKYGSGGLNKLKTEITDELLTKGAVAAVQVPGKPDSAGTQFFMCINAQPSLDGKYTVFARVVEGLLIAQKISETPVDDKGLATERVVITKVTIRDKPAATPEPFSTESVEDLAKYQAVLETSAGSITVAFTPDKAPAHVRNFLRLAQAGVYDGMSFHRVVKGFVVQSGHLPTRKEPLSETAAVVHPAAQGRVQRSGARPGNAVDGPHRRSRQRHVLVLHRHGAGDGPGRQVHCLRPRRQRHRGGAEDRSGGGERRDAGGPRGTDPRDGAEAVAGYFFVAASAITTSYWNRTKRCSSASRIRSWSLCAPKPLAPSSVSIAGPMP